MFGVATQFGPDWEARCPYCSFWANNLNSIREEALAADAPLAQIPEQVRAFVAAQLGLALSAKRINVGIARTDLVDISCSLIGTIGK